MFKRLIDFHLDKWKKDPWRKPLLLRGARQVGKTHAVRRLGTQFENFVEINFELLKDAINIFEKDLVPERILRALSLLVNQPIIPGKTLLFLDEVQQAPQAILALRYFYEQVPELHAIAAGSLLEFAIEKVGVPVGRIAMLYMYPMSFMEFLVATGDLLIAREILHHPVGLPMEDPIHTKILDKVGEYLSIGGMPESVERWMNTKDPAESLKVLRQIAIAYEQDFEKYAKKAQVQYLELLFRQIPNFAAKEFSYSDIHGGYRKRELAPALRLLEKAHILHQVLFCSGQGIPIGANTDFNIFKVIYLDVALTQAILGADISIWFLRPLEGFENCGNIAESFIGQELVCYANPESKAQLYFWKRKEKNSAAEVDYLHQSDQHILPVEVKSGHGTTLRSMHLFLDTHINSPLGIRFSSLDYSVYQSIDSRPLYAASSLAHPNQREALNALLTNK